MLDCSPPPATRLTSPLPAWSHLHRAADFAGLGQGNAKLVLHCRRLLGLAKVHLQGLQGCHGSGGECGSRGGAAGVDACAVHAIRQVSTVDGSLDPHLKSRGQAVQAVHRRVQLIQVLAAGALATCWLAAALLIALSRA